MEGESTGPQPKILTREKSLCPAPHKIDVQLQEFVLVSMSNWALFFFQAPQENSGSVPVGGERKPARCHPHVHLEYRRDR